MMSEVYIYSKNCQILRKVSTTFFCLLLLFCRERVNAQIFRDTASLSLVKRGVSCIYGMKFREAEDIFRKLNILYPDHPIGHLLEGMKVYWQNFPLTATSPARASFEKELKLCIDKCGKYDKADEAELLLTNLSARGLLLLFYTDNKLRMETLPLAESTYRYIRRSFEFTGKYYDFRYFSGLYNFYREAYPEAHPAYKPFALLFPKGDKKKGLADLHSASEHSIVLGAEASSFLSYIYMCYENNLTESAEVSKKLSNTYPSNMLYRSYYIKNLLLTKKYDEAEALINKSDREITNSFFHAQMTIFKGILIEKKYHDSNIAMQNYLRGIDQISSFGSYADEVVAYAYFGLSRISGTKNDIRNQRLYRKKALSLTDFSSINFDD